MRSKRQRGSGEEKTETYIFSLATVGNETDIGNWRADVDSEAHFGTTLLNLVENIMLTKKSTLKETNGAGIITSDDKVLRKKRQRKRRGREKEESIVRLERKMVKTKKLQEFQEME